MVGNALGVQFFRLKGLAPNIASEIEDKVESSLWYIASNSPSTLEL